LWIIGRADAFSHENRSIGVTDTATMPINIGDLENASPLQSGPAPGSIGAIVRNFKSISSRHINKVRGKAGATIWQRNYHDRIIRNDKELYAIRQYISDNPAKWAEDSENPNRS
ncbi:MAG TPA: transposase, partial [Anaerolineae bacterium]|nr:transposase [Anaerolineae bacterium]